MDIVFTTWEGSIDQYSIRIAEVIRGEEAWRRIYATNSYNDPPPDDMDYVLVYAVVDLLSSTGEGAVHMSRSDWQTLSGGRLYEATWAVMPEPAFRGDVFPGGSVEGWIVLQVKQTDSEPLLAWQVYYDGTGGIWFSLAD